MTIRTVLSAGVIALAIAQGPPATLDWATIAVEREAFFEDKPGEYGTAGRFDGVGMVYINAARSSILFRGFRRIATPHPGQSRDAEFELHQETFTIKTITSDGQGWTFDGVNDGPSARRIAGSLRYSPTKTAGSGAVTEFKLEEHGQTIKGVLNRLSLAKSSAATSMIRKFDVIFFGGNLVSYTVK